jgi:mannose-6-phosphate isomerase-like protein (cupin superfamily)
MQASSFDPSALRPAHGGTIKSGPILPEGFHPPFGHAWGYLEGPCQMEAHSHPTEEVYIFMAGEGVVAVDGEERIMKPGDVVNITPNAAHTVRNEREEPLLWAAFWWTVPE